MKAASLPAAACLCLNDSRSGFQRLDAGQNLALHPFKEGASSCGNIGEIIADTGLIEGGDRIAAAGHSHQFARIGQRASQFGDDTDRPLKKSDGAWTYFAGDIAYHLDKYERGFARQRSAGGFLLLPR